MLYASGALILIEVCLLLYCVLNIITTPPEQCRNLPKLLWLLLVIIFPLIGGIAWLVAGRPKRPARPASVTGERSRPSRTTASNPDDDEAFLAELRARAEQQRQRAAEEAERMRKDETPPPV